MQKLLTNIWCSRYAASISTAFIFIPLSYSVASGQEKQIQAIPHNIQIIYDYKYFKMKFIH